MSALLSKLKSNWIRVMLSTFVMIVFLLHAADVWRLGFVDQMENLAYDQHLRATMPNTLDDSVVIVDIDEVSLTAEGRWPWARNKLARLIENLFDEYQVRLVGFDIVFAEADESSGLTVLEDLATNALSDNTSFRSQLQMIRPELDYDGIFGETIQKYPIVLGYYFNIGETARINTLPEPAFEKAVFQAKNVKFMKATGYGANLNALGSSALGAGHFTQQPDGDGVVRRVPMLIRLDDSYYSSLSLEMVRHVLDAEIKPLFVQPLFDTGGYPGLEWLAVGDVRIPVDEHVRTLVPYRGGERSFPYVPATQVLHRVADKNLLKNSIVLIGTSAPGLLDLRATPVDEVYPGVEVHANLIAGMLSGNVKQLPEYVLGAEVVMLVIAGIGMILAGSLLSPLSATVYTLAGMVLYIGFNHLVWSLGNLVIPVASGLLMAAAMFVLQMSYGYFVETRGKRQITGLFGQYVPPELVDEMSKAPTEYSLAPESKELSVLFSDVRDFTSMSEGLSAGELSELMNRFLTPMTGVIHDARGTIDKYMGDAIMAFWGAPIPDDEHPRHALEAGMRMLAAMNEINGFFRDKGWPEIRIGVGINTGVMSVGNMGSEFRMAYTVMGDSVNLGSRLEGLTKNYGVELIVSESTKDAVPEYAYRELDRVLVKGKAKPVAIFEPLALNEALDRDWKKELKLYSETLRLYRTQQWDMAELNFVNLQRQSRSPSLYQNYAERIAHFRKEPPPPDWDGVFEFKTK